MGHSIHNVASLNGISIGFVRYDPAGQQPRRAVLDPRLSNALIELPCVSLPARECPDRVEKVAQHDSVMLAHHTRSLCAPAAPSPAFDACDPYNSVIYARGGGREIE